MRRTLCGAGGGVKLGRARSIARLLMFVLLMVALVLLTMAAFYYTRDTAEAIENELCQKMYVSVEQTRNNMDYRFEQAAESATALIGTLYPYLNSRADTAAQLQEYSEIRRALAEQLDKHMISHLRLYLSDDKIYSNQKTPLYSLNPLSVLGGADSPYQKGGVFWQETHPVSLGMADPITVISCAVALKSQASYDRLAGVLFADVAVDQFCEIFAAGSTDREAMCLVNASGVILAHKDGARLGEVAVSPQRMEKVRAQGSGYMLERDAILAFSRLDTSDWYIITSMDRARVYTMDAGEVNTIVFMWVAACMVLFIIAVTAVYSLNLNRTVSSINMAIATLEAESAPVPKARARRGKGGLISLERDTEQIMRSITDVVDARYRDRLAISEYQMEALQAQIKPHFLYNTLDIIKWMIMDKSLDDSVWMVNALSKYLRMSINKGEAIVPLAEELELTRTYLGIMQKRFSHQFEVEYDLDDAALECLIPKLSLQPLVENALLHGILYCDKPDKRLIIRAWRSACAFGVEIEDNGNGMAPEAARHLAEMDVQASKSYGVANVRTRLDIFGHGKCKFYISAREGLGTCVMIELPIQTDGSK